MALTGMSGKKYFCKMYLFSFDSIFYFVLSNFQCHVKSILSNSLKSDAPKMS